MGGIVCLPNTDPILSLSAHSVNRIRPIVSSFLDATLVTSTVDPFADHEVEAYLTTAFASSFKSQKISKRAHTHAEQLFHQYHQDNQHPTSISTASIAPINIYDNNKCLTQAELSMMVTELLHATEAALPSFLTSLYSTITQHTTKFIKQHKKNNKLTKEEQALIVAVYQQQRRDVLSALSTQLALVTKQLDNITNEMYGKLNAGSEGKGVTIDVFKENWESVSNTLLSTIMRAADCADAPPVIGEVKVDDEDSESDSDGIPDDGKEASEHA